MKVRFLIILLFVTVFSIHLPSVFGCSCVGWTDQEALENSVSSFIGTPIKIESPSGYQNLVTFQIEKPIKNIADNKTEITVSTSTQDSACGYYFDTQTRYLVHTSGESDQKILETGLCSGNKNLGESNILALPNDSESIFLNHVLFLNIVIVGIIITGIILGYVIIIRRKRK